MVGVTLAAALLLAGQDAPWQCGRCGQALSESETELQGHTPSDLHMHPMPCQIRVHRACGQPVQRLERPEWRELKAERVTVRDDAWKSHPLLAFEGRAGDFEERARAHREGDSEAVKKLQGLKAGDEAALYLLWGWSTSGADPARKTRVTAQFSMEDRTIRVTVVRAVIRDSGDAAGTSDMQYVGFGVAVGKLEEGEYTVRILEQLEFYKDVADAQPKVGARKLLKEIKFQVR